YLYCAFNVRPDILQKLFNVAFRLTELLGKFSVDFRKNPFSHFAHSNGEFRSLAGDFLAAVVFRECQGEGFFLACLHTRNSFFELRKHTALAQHEGETFSLAAFEFFTVDAADEIECNAIVFARFTAFTRLVNGALLTEDIDGPLSIGVSDFTSAARHGECREIRHFNFGVDLEGGGKCQLAL